MSGLATPGPHHHDCSAVSCAPACPVALERAVEAVQARRIAPRDFPRVRGFPGLEPAPALTFWIPGKPATKGSTRSVWSAKGGKPVTLPDCKRLKSWSETVGWYAVAAVARDRARFPIEGPVALDVVFYLARPRERLGWPTSAPDLDKLVRALADPLSGIVYRDDAQVVATHAQKLYADPAQAGVWLTVVEMGAVEEGSA